MYYEKYLPQKFIHVRVCVFKLRLLEVFSFVVYNLTMNDFVFREMNLEHVLKMRNWGKNDDAILESYDFWPTTFDECKYWFYQKTKKKTNKYYVYLDGDNVICYLSTKKIDRTTGVSTLGIVMDPNYQSRGYGYAIMRDFLKRYFSWGFKSMNLTVATFNIRAINLYKKLGFKFKRRVYSLFDGTKDQISDDKRMHFIFLPGLVISKNYLMVIGGDVREIC